MGDFKWKEAVAGAVSGSLTVVALQPLDTIKTRLQVQEKGTQQYRGLVHALKNVASREGVQGLYAGLMPSLLGSAISWGLYWLSWKTIHDWHCAQLGTTELTWQMKLLCGMEAGICVTCITNPIWVVKTRMQLQTRAAAPAAAVAAAQPRPAPQPRQQQHMGLRACVRNIATQEGFRGFYRGLGPALLLCSHGAVQFMAYEELKAWRLRTLAPPPHPSPLETLVSQTPRGVLPHVDTLLLGAAAKLAASVCTYPLQVARSRMQQQLRGEKLAAYGSLPRALGHIVRRDGVAGLYRGFVANAVKVCPHAALQFYLYEQSRRLLGP